MKRNQLISTAVISAAAAITLAAGSAGPVLAAAPAVGPAESNISVSMEVVAPAGARTAAPKVGSNGELTPAQQKNQEKLFAFSDWLAAQPAAVRQGYIQRVNDATTLSVKLLWDETQLHSAAPALAEAAKRGIKASVVGRKATADEIDRTLSLLQANAQSAVPSGYKVESIVGLQENVDGVELKIVGDPAAAQARTLASSAEQVRASLIRAVGANTPAPVKVTVVQADSGASSRGVDNTPFYAGAWIKSACTTGFSLKYKGVARLTTATHCRGPYASSGGASMGTRIASSAQGQAVVLSGKGMGRMYTGSWSSGTYKDVKGYRDVGLGDWICISGAQSGQRCNLVVSSMRVRWFDGWTWADNIGANAPTGNRIANVQGDSGGPLFTNTTGGVRAVGMVQAYGSGWVRSGTACGNVRLKRSDIKCSDVVYFTSTRTIANSLGATLVTR